MLVSILMFMYSVAIIPPKKFQGEQKEDGSLRADAYWHGEILEMRQKEGLMQVNLYLILLLRKVHG